uniref:adenosine deaminase n=1 Tax=Clostridium polynesiense TaxID=1325933 RepID=UPI00058D1605
MEFKSLPKIELHCHLDGSVRIETIIDIARKENIQLPTYDTNELKKLVTVTDGCSCLVEYISKFKIPIMVMQSKESLRRIAFELYEDAARENVKYLEVRFAPLLHTEKGLATNEIIESVVQGMRDAETLYDIKGNVILSFMKNMPEESIFPVIEAAAKYIGKGVAAVDLAGGEDEGFSRKFVNAIKKAEELGYRITIHAGETGIGKNVLEAVNLLGAERIGHGIFITNSPEAYKLV